MLKSHRAIKNGENWLQIPKRIGTSQGESSAQLVMEEKLKCRDLARLDGGEGKKE